MLTKNLAVDDLMLQKSKESVAKVMHTILGQTSSFKAIKGVILYGIISE